MRLLSFLFYLLLPTLCFSQNAELRKRIDSNVLAIKRNPAQTSSFKKSERVNGRETTVQYSFKLINGQPNHIAREYSNKDSSVRQHFYSSNSKLVYSTESITNYYGKDSIGWGGSYWFEYGKLKDYETLGHGKSEIETWKPEIEVLNNYQKAKSAVKTYLKK